MQDTTNKKTNTDSIDEDVQEIELTDEDILDAMKHIPGYLDITTADFRVIYHLAHRHAVERMVGSFSPENLMRVGFEPLRPDMLLDEAATALAKSGYKSLPVVDTGGYVIGVLTENDFLKRLNVSSFLEFLLNMPDKSFELKHRCHETLVSNAMTAAVITVVRDASFTETLAAFHRHQGGSMAVVDSDGRLLGLLLLNDFLNTFHLEIPR
ncbi:MAG: CBS domain-containing protein [Gallionella sp.]